MADNPKRTGVAVEATFARFAESAPFGWNGLPRRPPGKRADANLTSGASMIAVARHIRYCPWPLPPRRPMHVRRAKAASSRRLRRPAEARARRDAGAELAARSRQPRGQRDAGDQRHDARRIVSASARGGVARILSSAAAVRARRRRRRRPLADRGRQDRRRGGSGGNPAGDASGAALRPHHRGRDMDRAVADEIDPRCDWRAA